MHNWYLLYLKPKWEDRVSLRLEESGFEVYNPKLKERKYIRRKLQYVISPLFPCYLFVKFELLKSYRIIKYTRGVKTVVGNDGCPIAAPDGIIDSIKAKAQDGTTISIQPKGFVSGEPVLIKGGPFQGIDAIFENEMKGVERVSILLKEINARVLIDRCLLERA
ncbi:MAG: hypothetical protein HY954_09150 [Deltaproteobacteria bacterium]|nr:hypothetical protein [Deltaproteobacteria bacterium]